MKTKPVNPSNPGTKRMCGKVPAPAYQAVCSDTNQRGPKRPTFQEAALDLIDYSNGFVDIVDAD